MEAIEVVQAVAEPMGSAGAAFYFTPATLERGKEIGLDGLRFYVLGRGGVLGDVPHQVVESAFGYFAGPMIDKMWNSGRERVSAADAADAYFECDAAHGRTKLGQLDGLAGYCAAAEQVVAAARPAALPLFAGYAAMPLAEDLPARALQLTSVLRELRGSAHLVAIASTGLSDVTAHAIRRPDDLKLFGYEDLPAPTEAEKQLLAEADARTDLMLVAPYSVLDDSAGSALVAGATAIAEALA